MHTFTFPIEFIERFNAYLASSQYQDIPEYAKSNYWQFHSKQIDISIARDKITIAGMSGYYIPPARNEVFNFSHKVKKILEEPKRFVPALRSKLERRVKLKINLLSYANSFNAVMNFDTIADIQAHPSRIDFRKLSALPEVIRSTREMEENFFAKQKYQLNPQIIQSYYFYNILCGYVNTNQIKTVLDIGAGNGNSAAVFHHHLKSKVIIVDLPETLCLSMAFLADLFPDAKILMPHEIDAQRLDDYDFIFMTPRQTSWIKDNSVDLATNTSSFQEMTQKQIEEYFDLIQRVCRNNAHFFTHNRVEKIPVHTNSVNQQPDEKINRFFEYPWKSNEVLAFEICRFSRLVQLDDMYIRLEKIQK